HHKPAAFDYAARFGMPLRGAGGKGSTAPAPTAPPAQASRPDEADVVSARAPTATVAPVGRPQAAEVSESVAAGHRCRHCGHTEPVIAHGRYGYYFKCLSCSGNTPIKLDCGQPAHKERLRKDGPRFYRE